MTFKVPEILLCVLSFDTLRYAVRRLFCQAWLHQTTGIKEVCSPKKVKVTFTRLLWIIIDNARLDIRALKFYYETADTLIIRKLET